jgi:patatin-like phospholipase/acyl hydrolase
VTFRILALSGGGYLGLYSARLLTRLEATAGQPIARCFDLISGTSAGAIAALALSLEIPAADIERTFVEYGPRIFPQINKPFREMKRTLAFLRSLLRPKYSDANLRSAIGSLIPGDKTLAASRHRLALPIVNMTTGQIEVIKTPHLATWTHHAGFMMVEVGVAAAAAPTYFPMAELSNSLYVDGAIFANAPDLVGVHEAEYYLKTPAEQIEVLSIGTTTGNFSLPYSQGRAYGSARWLRGGRLFATIMSAQQQLTQVFLRHHLGDRYLRIDTQRAPGLEYDLTFDGATQHGTKTILSLADHAFEEALKRPRVVDMLQVTAPTPIFYPGLARQKAPALGTEDAAATFGAHESPTRRAAE